MKLWREEPPEIVNGIVTKGGMFEHQAEWWNLPNFIKALIAGYGAGKTLIGAKRQIALALHNAPAPALVISPSYKMAKRTVIPMIISLLEGKQSLHRNLWFKFNKTDHEFKINYRGRQAIIWIASGDEPKSLKGPNVGSAWIDEPFIQSKDVLDETMARVRDPLAKIREISMTGTPEELNWGYDICEGEMKDDYNVGIIRAHTKMNLALDTSYSERLEQALTGEAADAYLGGHFVNLSQGRTYYGFNRERNVVALQDPGHELHVGMDFNVNPMAAIVFWINGVHMHIEDEIELPNADTHTMCQELLRKYVYPRGHQYQDACRVQKIFPDSSGVARKTSAAGGASDFSIIKDHKFIIDAPPANPPIRDRENAVNGKLNPAKGNPTLTIHPRCKKLIGYLEKYTAENKSTKAGKAMSHLLDATGYPVHRMWPVHRPSIIAQHLVGT